MSFQQEKFQELVNYMQELVNGGLEWDEDLLMAKRMIDNYFNGNYLDCLYPDNCNFTNYGYCDVCDSSYLEDGNDVKCDDLNCPNDPEYGFCPRCGIENH